MGLFSKTFDPTLDLSDLTGKVIIVTGANGGIGYATIKHLAQHGANVYMASRNEDKAKAAIERLNSDRVGSRNSAVRWLQLDLSDPRKAKQAADEFLKLENRLDVLINNAAMPRGPYAKTHDGIQDAMMVNHISPFVFTMALLPLLTETARDVRNDVRIVNLSSDGIRLLRHGIRFQNIDDFNDEHKGEFASDLMRYCRSKLANVLFTTELQRRLDASHIPIITTAIDPGLVLTEGVQNDAASQPPIISHLFSLVINTMWTAPTRGAFASVFAAAAPIVREQKESYGGAYIQPPGRLGNPPNADARRPELAKELWRTTEMILKDIGVDLPALGI